MRLVTGIAIRGIQPTIDGLRRIEHHVIMEQERAVQALGSQLFRTILARITHDFQSVPSYIYESKLGLPGTKPEYATLPLRGGGIFAQTAAALGQPWDRMLQHYRLGPHTLSEELTVATSRQGFQITASVGYREDIPRRLHLILLWVTRGTQLMQARPFLELALYEMVDDIREVCKNAVQQALR